MHRETYCGTHANELKKLVINVCVHSNKLYILGVWSFTVANRPGHQAMVGSLIPPSNVVSLPQRNGPFVPPADTHTQNRYAMI